MYLLAAIGLIWVFIAAICALPLYLLNVPLAEFFYNSFGKVWLLLYDVRVKIHGIENLPKPGTGVIIAPNHESTFDIFLLSALPLKIRWISKYENGYFPFVGWAMKAMGCYFVKRNKSSHDVRVLKKVEEDLKKGSRLCIFPEGTRTRTGELLPFKKGPFRTAQNANVCILPVAITGSREVAPARGVPTRRGFDVILRFGRPFPVPKGDLPPIMANYRKTLLNLLQEDRGKG